MVHYETMTSPTQSASSFSSAMDSRQDARAEFVAIDFETANQYRQSACSVGLAKFNAAGDVLDEYYTLIRPPREFGEFYPRNIAVHGIHASDVVHAPQWNDIVSDIENFVGDRALVAHNMPFDGSVINKLTEYYALRPWNNERLCTLKLSRNLLKGQIDSFGLEPVYDYFFPDDVFDHHNAAADALVCGKIFAQLSAQFGDDVIRDVSVKGAKSWYIGHAKTKDTPRIDRRKSYAMPFIPRKVAFLHGAHIAIAGSLSYGPRAQVESLIRSLGGHVSAAVTEKTTLLLVGSNHDAMTSVKIQKAQDLQRKGHMISILNEDEFFRGLSDVSKEFA